MANLMALDLSFKCSACAVSNNGHVECFSQSFDLPKTKKGEPKPHPDLRFAAFDAWLLAILELHKPDALAYEQTHMQGREGATIHHFMYGCIRGECAKRGIKVYSLSPLSLKKYATGSGKADKQNMKDEAARRFKWYDPTEDAGGDSADALLLMCWLKEEIEK